MQKLDFMITEGKAKSSSSKSMSDAVANTEKIREWKEHRTNVDELLL